MSSTTLILNPKAVIFTPNKSKQLKQQKQVALSPIMEEKWLRHELYPPKDILNCKYIIYISTQITKKALNDHLFDEYFPSESDLFYFLKYWSRKQVIDGSYTLFRSFNNEELVIFNAELHSKTTKLPLFVIALPNDRDKEHIVKWKMIQFMTATQILETLNINDKDLPIQSRSILYKHIQSKMKDYKNDINMFKKRLNMITIKKMSRIRKIKSYKNGEKTAKPLRITYNTLYECIKLSIEFNDLENIIWFNQHQGYRAQILLPIEIDNNWIGIAFDYDDNKELYPVKICIDDVDIRRKLALFKPCSDEGEYRRFSNNIKEFQIIDDMKYYENKIADYEDKMVYYENRISDLIAKHNNLMQAKDAEIKDLKEQIQRMNNI